jgi:5-methylcytosine-specific restriction endonuclease McrA
VGYYQRCKHPKPEIGAVTGKIRDLLDAKAERTCRALVKQRDDNRCRVPGCRRFGKHLHHIVYRSKSKGLRWATSNTCLLCVDHHRLEHAGEIRIRGNADRHLVITGDVDRVKRVRL